MKVIVEKNGWETCFESNFYNIIVAFHLMFTKSYFLLFPRIYDKPFNFVFLCWSLDTVKKRWTHKGQPTYECKCSCSPNIILIFPLEFYDKPLNVAFLCWSFDTGKERWTHKGQPTYEGYCSCSPDVFHSFIYYYFLFVGFCFVSFLFWEIYYKPFNFVFFCVYLFIQERKGELMKANQHIKVINIVAVQPIVMT